eukprot:jgi/Mesen1/4984/ME000248S04268
MDNMGHGSSSNNSSSMSHHHMHMSFYWSEKATILFDQWTTQSMASYWAAMLLTFLFCILHEWLTTSRVRVAAPARTPLMKDEMVERSDSEQGPMPLLSDGQAPVSGIRRAGATLLYGLNAASSYIIMLIIMTFNMGLFFSVVLGLSTGFFLFGFSRVGSSSQLCHAS